MPELPRIEYVLEADDAVALSRHLHAHSSTLRRVRLTAQLVAPLVGILPFGLEALHSASPWPLLLGVVLAAAAFLLIGWVHDRLADVSARRLHRESGERVRGPHELLLETEGLRTRGPVGDSLLRWDAIERVDLSDGQLFVTVGPLRALIVPRHRVLDGSWEPFVDVLRERVAAARSTTRDDAAEPGAPER